MVLKLKVGDRSGTEDGFLLMKETFGRPFYERWLHGRQNVARFLDLMDPTCV